MAAISDDISDRDLREKLKENGISAGPITPTTRSLYIRKLNRKLSGAENSPNSSAKKPAKKSLSPRRSPGRSPARDSRRSVGTTPPQVPQRKLVGFSSDEEEASKETTLPKSKRVSGRFKPTSSVPTHSPRLNEERPLLRFRKHVDTPSFRISQDDEKVELDGRVTIPQNYRGFKQNVTKLPPYSGLRQLFMRKSMEDNSKSLAESENTTMFDDVETEDEERKNVHSCTWVLLLLLCVVVVVVFFNWQLLPTFLWRGGDGNNLKMCGPDSSGMELDDCMSEDNFTRLLLHHLEIELAKKSGLVHCGYLSEGGEMKKADLEKWVAEWIKDKRFTSQNVIKNMVKFINLNTAGYNLRFLGKNRNPVNDSVEFAIVKTSLALKPLFCRIQEAISKVMFQLIVLCAGILFGLSIYFIVKYRWMLREKRTRQMFELVDKILEVLKNHHQECQRDKNLSPYLAIPHVRDMLIKPSERESMKDVWDQAVKFLSAKDSRVRVESQRIAGEDFEVWRLLHHGSPSNAQSSSSSNTKDEKVWQGQAFEDFQSAVNPPLISPTPCLKIRNMFEPVMETRHQWHIFIQDAILEKCNEKGASVVHIAVDQSSSEGCVYVKCADHRSSGAAFRAIHGCWFDGRLVTVKFLTLKRYHQRFPESVTAKEPIKPSGTSASTIPKLKSEPVDESDSDSDSEHPIVT